MDSFKDAFLNISIFLHPQIFNSCISAKYRPIRTSMEHVFIQLLDGFTFMTCFVVQGHIKYTNNQNFIHTFVSPFIDKVVKLYNYLF